MDVLSRLKDAVQATVSTTVSQISHALPGNPVLREYDVVNQTPVCTAGPGLFWKAYSAKKKSTQQDASLFVFEKKALDVFSRKDKEYIIEVLKKGVVQLTRLRHPGILTVQHAMEESRDSLAFATEPITTSLANVLDESTPFKAEKIELSPIEIKYGLYQLCNSLIFLHKEAKIVHTSLSPANVVIDAKGTWKLFGFDFCATNTMQLGQTPSWNCKEPDSELPSVAQADLDYLAPEFGRNKGRGSLQETTVSITPAADLYSLGCLIVSIFNKGKAPYQFGDDFAGYFKQMGMYGRIGSGSLIPVPMELKDLVSSLLSANPDDRPQIEIILQLNYFEDPCVKALLYLDTLFQRENLHKSQFFRSLPDILPKLSTRLKIHRVVPCLDVECKATPAMAPFILPSLIAIAQDLTNEEYDKYLLPCLRGLMKMTEPIQIALMFLKNLDLLLDKSSIESVKSDLTPLVTRCMDQPSTAEACLGALPKLASKLDFPSLRGSLLPKIKKLCVDPENLSLRVQGLLCLAKMLDFLDKWTVLDEVLPLLHQLPGKNQSAIIMASIGIYRLALEQPKLGIPKEYIATKVLPSLWPMAVEPSLNLVQLEALLQLIKDMGNRVETAQKRDLQSSAELNSEHKKMLDTTFVSSNNVGQPIGTVRKTEEVKAESWMRNGSVKIAHDQKKSEPSQALRASGSSQSVTVQSPVQPKPVIQPTLQQPSIPMLSKPPTYQPKDLTSSLIDSNLKNLILAPKPSETFAATPTAGAKTNLSNYGVSGQGFENASSSIITTDKNFGGMSANSAMTNQGFVGVSSISQSQSSVNKFSASSDSKTGYSALSVSQQNTFGATTMMQGYGLNLSGVENAPLLGSPPAQPSARPSGVLFGSSHYTQVPQSGGQIKSLGQKDLDDLLG